MHRQNVVARGHAASAVGHRRLGGRRSEIEKTAAQLLSTLEGAVLVDIAAVERRFCRRDVSGDWIDRFCDPFIPFGCARIEEDYGAEFIDEIVGYLCR